MQATLLARGSTRNLEDEEDDNVAATVPLLLLGLLENGGWRDSNGGEEQRQASTDYQMTKGQDVKWRGGKYRKKAAPAGGRSVGDQYTRAGDRGETVVALMMMGARGKGEGARGRQMERVWNCRGCRKRET
jgi:hypothetical protein